MREIDSALTHLLPILEKWDCFVKASQCRNWLDSGDEVGAKRWLYETLKAFEEDETCSWGKRESGLVLFQAAMIWGTDVPKGAANLLNEVEEASS